MAEPIDSINAITRLIRCPLHAHLEGEGMQGAMGFPVDLERDNQKGYIELSFSRIVIGLRWLTIWSFVSLLDSQQHEISLFPCRDLEADTRVTA